MPEVMLNGPEGRIECKYTQGLETWMSSCYDTSP